MSEPAVKRRLRAWESRTTAEYKAQGYAVTRIEGGAFHLLACRGKTARAIRISIGPVHYDEIMLVKREPLPARCLREIRKPSDDGKTVTVALIE